MAQDLASAEGGEATSERAALRVFLSYSRVDLDTADRMVSALEAAGISVTIDRRDLPYGEEWQKELADFIAQSDTVVWLVSPDSVRSKWCNWELGEVGRLSKRLVPVKVREVAPEALPESLGRIHLLPGEGVYEEARHLDALVTALNTDRAWLKRATSLGEDAREWQAKGRDGALLLRGRALTEAEAWSVATPPRAPPPSSEILELILASRAAQRSGLRRIVAGSVAAAVVAVALAAAAVWFGISASEQAAEAERQRQTAQTNEERALAQEAEANRQRSVAETNEARAREQEAEANRQRSVAQENEARARQERNAALASEVSRVASVAKPYLSSGRPDIALGFGLDVAPRDRDDEAPLSKDLEMVLRRAWEQMPAARERKVLDNAFRVAVSPDGKLVAVGTAGADPGKGMLHVFDAATMAERYRVKAMDDVISGIDFSADSKSIVVAGGKTPGVWDAETGKQRFPLALPNGLNGYTKWAEFAPDGSYIALSTSSNAVLLYDAPTGALLHTLPGDKFEEITARMPPEDDPIVSAVTRTMFLLAGAAMEFVITPDSRLVAITGPGALDGSVKLFDARTGMLKQRLTGGAASRLGGPIPLNHTMAISTDGMRVVAAPVQRTIKTWTVDDGKLTGETVSRDINVVALTADGRVAISGHHDGTLVFRCLEGMMESVSLRAHSDRVQGIVIDAGRSRMATISDDGTAKLWRLPGGEEICLPLDTAETLDVVGKMRPLAVLSGHGSIVLHAAFSPDGKTLYTTSQDGRVRVWRLPGRTFSIGDWQPGNVTDIDNTENLIIASTDGRTLFVSDGQVDAFTAVDVASGKTTRLRAVEAVAPEAPGGRPWLFRAPTDHYPYGGGTDAALQGYNSWPSMLVSRDGKTAYVAAEYGSEKPATLVDTATDKELAAIAIEGRAPAYLGRFFSRDSRLFFSGFDRKATGGNEGLAVWDTATGKLRAFAPELEKYSSGADHYASRDGTVVVFDGGSTVGVVKVGAASIDLLDVPGFGAIGAARTVTEDGTRLVEARADGTVSFFPLDGGDAHTVLLDFARPILVEMSLDGEVVAVVDIGNVVTIASVADGRVLHSLPLAADFLAVRFLPDKRIVIVDQAGGITLLPRVPGSDILGDGASFVDWLRAKRHGVVSVADRGRFGLTGAGPRERPDLAAIKAFPVPARRENPAPSPEAGQCDAAAANPYDRDKRAQGVLFDSIETEAALAVCRQALALVPDDLQTIYQVARLHDRLGRVREAYDGYRIAADKGYAIAMRAIARLLEVAKAGELPPEAGTAAEWTQKAVTAGDTWSLWTAAVDAAHAAPVGQASVEALAMLASSRNPNRAQAALVLANQLFQRGDAPGAEERARFYALLGLHLYDTYADPAPFEDPQTYDWTVSFVRDLGATMPPAELVALYRQARDWRAE